MLATKVRLAYIDYITSRVSGETKATQRRIQMSNYTINSECGVAKIEADSIEAAKEAYEQSHHFDFDNFREFPGSWYFINEDGVCVESETQNMPN